MKFTKYFMPFAALALLASCSNDNLDNPKENGIQEETNNVDAAYVAFNIAMPSLGTKAGETYNDGYTGEADVNDVWLYLYRASKEQNLNGETTYDKETTEADAELYICKKVYFENKSDAEANHDGSSVAVDAVTSTINAIFQLENVTEDDKNNFDYYAFIVVNKPDGIAEGNEGDEFSVIQADIQTASSHAVAQVSGDTGEEKVTFSTTPSNGMLKVDGTKVYFTMTNAPLVDEEKTAVTYLAKLDTGAFAVSPAQASSAAATVVVQRGVAKVEMDIAANNANDIVIDDEGNKYNTTAKVQITNWILDVVNANGYTVQKVPTIDAFQTDGAWSGTHFLSSAIAHNVVTDDNKAMYHIYWSMDPEYDDDALTAAGPDQGDYLTLVEEGDRFNNLTDVEYCLENTMDYNKMQKNQSTRIVFKGVVKLDGTTAEDFIYYPGSDIAYGVEGKVNSSSTSDQKLPGAKYKLSALLSGTTEEKDVIRKAIKAVDLEEEVYYYPGGVTYYTTIIRHFTDSQAGGDIYGEIDSLDKYVPANLGRYGVVRNNWYKASISKVFGFGKPEIPDPTPDPDDDPDPIKYNIQLNINVLAWTMRTNGYILK